jgi:hypothetical protein
LKQSYLAVGKLMKNGAINRQKRGNDLVTELLLFDAFFCIFSFRNGRKSMQYNETNQRVTSKIILSHLGDILLPQLLRWAKECLLSRCRKCSDTEALKRHKSMREL